MTQITILSGVERRRRWSDERKLALVEAAIAPGASVAAIARAADISPSSINRWRRNLCSKLAQPAGFAAMAVHAGVGESSATAVALIIHELATNSMRRLHTSVCRLQTHAASVASIRSRRSPPKPLVTALSQKASMTAENPVGMADVRQTGVCAA
jgi:transposase